ncbi:MAG: type II toxin-antitoxin system HicB family antitoxin [Myxococcota bacterium]
MIKLLTRRRVNHYLRLQYPADVSMTDDGSFFGTYPDLPGCEAMGESPAALFVALDAARKRWISDRLSAGGQIPAPNTHLAERAEPMPLSKTISLAV